MPEGRAAILFPGQGVAAARADAVAARPDLVAALDALMGRDAFADAAHSTASAQPAIYCASLAAWSTRPIAGAGIFAGHSLGELTALAAAGWLDELDGLRLVVRRGALMEEACASRAGGMLALLGVSGSDAAALAARYGVTVANDNAPGQVVLSGEVAKLDALVADTARDGIARVRLPVAGAFHSPLMEPAVAPFRRALAQVRFTPRETIVLSASTLAPFGRVRDELAAALIRPVRWREALLALWDAGARRFVDVGPGQTLGALVRRTLPDAATSYAAAPSL